MLTREWAVVQEDNGCIANILLHSQRTREHILISSAARKIQDFLWRLQISCHSRFFLGIWALFSCPSCSLFMSFLFSLSFTIFIFHYFWHFEIFFKLVFHSCCIWGIIAVPMQTGVRYCGWVKTNNIITKHIYTRQFAFSIICNPLFLILVVVILACVWPAWSRRVVQCRVDSIGKRDLTNRSIRRMVNLYWQFVKWSYRSEKCISLEGLRKYLTQVAKRMKDMKMVCDKFHFRNHVDSWCKANCNPHTSSELKVNV